MTDYERYLERYCIKHGISKEEAKDHALVRAVKAQYDKKDDTTKTVGWKEKD